MVSILERDRNKSLVVKAPWLLLIGVLEPDFGLCCFSLSCLIINMLSEVCYGILLHVFRRLSCRTWLNTDLRSDRSCSYTLVHKWFLDLPLDNRSWLRPSTEDVSAYLYLCIPPRCAAHEKKLLAQKISVLISRQSDGHSDRCAYVDLILTTENLGEWSISLVREKTKLSYFSPHGC